MVSATETLGNGPANIEKNVPHDVERAVRKALYRLGDILRNHEGRLMDSIATRAAQIAATSNSMLEFQHALEKLIAKTEDFAMTAEI